MEGEFADIYAGLANRGIGPRVADEMELFEIAATFGLHRPEKDADPEKPAEPKFDLVKYRVQAAEAARAGKPPPPLPPGVRL